MRSALSPRAARLLKELQTGERFAEANVYPDSLAFNDHAIAYLNNAAALCRTQENDDFRIFGALYCLRHGLELWLKCLNQNEMIDLALEAIAEPEATLASVLQTIGLSGSKKEKQRLAFEACLCAYRNIVTDRIVFPECWNLNISREHAERAVGLIRSNGAAPRGELAIAWKVPIVEHKIAPLWKAARPLVVDLRRGVCVHTRHTGLLEPLAVERIDAICELIADLDRDGVAFRYPLSLDGTWHFGLPALNLDVVATLADELEATVLAYDSTLSDGYSHALLRSPRPRTLEF